MIHNERKIGEEAGYWFGKEIECTQFVGLNTIFFSRFTALNDKQGQIGDIEHVFIAQINPKFWEGTNDHLYPKEHLESIILDLLDKGKKVTVELEARWSKSYVGFRRDFHRQFCLLLVMEISQLQLGGWAIKAAPPVVFQNRENEKCVMTADFEVFEDGATFWPQYEEDYERAL